MLARDLGRGWKIPCCGRTLPRRLPAANSVRAWPGFCQNRNLNGVPWELRRLSTRRSAGLSAVKKKKTEDSDSVVDLDKLLDSLPPSKKKSDKGPKWLQDIQQQGRALAQEVDSLRKSVQGKSLEMEKIKKEMKKVKREASETQVLLTACQGELELKAAEVETLKEEVKIANASREADFRSTMERYRELEEALALAQKELEDRPMEGETGWVVNDGLEKLREVMNNQEQVLGDLFQSLESSRLAKAAAEAKTAESEKLLASQENKLMQLQAHHEALEGSLDEAKSALENAEAAWAVEMKEFEARELNLRDEALVTDRKVADLTTALKDSHSAMEVLRFEHEQQKELTDTLERRCKKLQAAKEALTLNASRKGNLDSTALRSKIGSLEDNIKNLKLELATARGQEAGLEQKVRATAEEAASWRSQYKKVQEARRRSQTRLEEKSIQLGTANKEKREAFFQARKTGRQLSVLESEVARLTTRVNKKTKEADDLKVELNAARSNEEKGLVNLAKVQQELEHLCEGEAIRVAETTDLRNKVAKMQTKLSKMEDDFDKLEVAKAAEVNSLKEALKKTQEKAEAESKKSAAASEKMKAEALKALQEKTDAQIKEMEGVMDEERKTFEAEKVKLLSKIEDVQGKMKSSEKASEASAAEVKQLEKIRDELKSKVAKLEADGEANKEDKEVIQSLKKTSKAKAAELAEATKIVSELTEQTEALQTALKAKSDEVKKAKIGLVSDKKLEEVRKGAESLKVEVKTLQQSLEQEKKLVTTAKEGKASSDAKIVDLTKELKARENDIGQLRTLVQESKEEGNALRESVEQSEAALADFQRQAADEMEAAATLLDKAEKVAMAVKQSITTPSQTEPPIDEQIGAESSGVDDEARAEYEGHIAELEAALQEQSLVAADATDKADALQVEVQFLVDKMESLQKNQQQSKEEGKKVQPLIASLQEKLSQALTAESAAKEEVSALKEQLSAKQAAGVGKNEGGGGFGGKAKGGRRSGGSLEKKSTRRNVGKSQASSGGGTNGDMEVEADVGSGLDGMESSDALSKRVQELEDENARLKRSAAKRNQVLAQSRRFIEQYLKRSVAVLGEKK
ncbi:hypothetical protein BSKO_06908 [Bryopsis sp. KO-2023]|nr:hypothetical protein BSKO_06908 [Bryopsis sp. KO-2023]